jgi:hypothetical protein
MISEWDPILTPNLTEYALVRLNNDILEIKFAKQPRFSVIIDKGAIPQLIKILERLNCERSSI